MTPRGLSITVVLNYMRLMVILDWWMELTAFISQRGPVQEIVRSKENEEPKRDIADDQQSVAFSCTVVS